MARRAEPLSVFEEVNLLLFTALEHGARHVALRPQGGGMEVSFLRADGREQTERLAVPYEPMVKQLRQMHARLGRVHIDMGGNQWQLDAVVPNCRLPDRVFLHMRPAERSQV